MNADEAIPLDEQFTARLVACDEALAAGALLSESSLPSEAPELRNRLEKGMACLQLLQQLRPRPNLKGEPSTAPPVGVLSPVAPDAPPVLGHRYEIRRELGRGAFGIVFLAYDRDLQREVALKVPRAEALATEELHERFLREARAAASLDHPNIVPVHDVNVGLFCYIASAYCPGLTLAQWLKPRTTLVPWRDTARFLTILAWALDHAHTRGVIHRDLKPSNLMLSPCERAAAALETQDAGQETDSLLTFVPRVMDFGLAKVLAESEANLTVSRAVMGTPAYMAPEQAEGRSKDVGAPADIYALGVILYELLTGHPPFKGANNVQTLEQVRTKEPPPPQRLHPGLPRALNTITLRCLEKDPGQRFPSAKELAEDLERFLAGEPIRSRPRPLLTRVTRAARRHTATVLVGLAAAIAPLFLLVPSLFKAPPSPEEIEERRKAERCAQFVENLKAGRKAVAIENTGPPLRFRCVLGEPTGKTSLTPDNTFRVENTQLGLVEIVDDPQVDCFWLRAEVRNDEGVPITEVGLYFAHSTKATPLGTQHYFCTVGFNDKADRKQLGGYPNQIRINVCRYPIGNMVKRQCWREALDPEVGTPNVNPWHRLAVKVTRGQAMLVSWGDREPIGKPFTQDDFMKGRKAVLANDPCQGDPAYAARSPLGLYVRGGAATFRNVVIEPIDGDK